MYYNYTHFLRSTTLFYCADILINNTIPRPRRSNDSKQSCNATRIRNIANEKTDINIKMNVCV